MSKKITLSNPLFRVVTGDPQVESTWQELEVQSITPDMLRAEQLFARHKWGKTGDMPMKTLVVAAWAALVRTNQIEGSLEAFEAQLIDISADADDVDEVGPTQPALEAE